MKSTYLAVAGRIRRALEQLEAVARRALVFWNDAAPHEAGDYRLDAVALNLHGFYAGLERIFDVIAIRIDDTVPDGAHWHQELLDQMETAVPTIRPAVLASDTRTQLEAFRGFRHVVRNGYTFEFDPEQMALLIRRLPDARRRVHDDLSAFADLLERIAEDDQPADAAQ
ncbi:MAG: antitoxin [Bacteroidetes bacterium]|jgi:hypothetical protein|nr:antitoxin [Bacteroidota bacterium]